MTEHRSDARCDAVYDELVELALGTLSGVERSSILGHVQECPRCREEADRLSSVADAILSLAPEVEPPPGFETRVFSRMGVRLRRHRIVGRVSRRVALAGSALLASLGLGLGLGLSTGGSALSEAPIVANLTAGHVNSGEVYVAPGDPAWLFMSVDHVDATGLVLCRVRTLGGATKTVGSFWLHSGAGTWLSRLPVPASQVRSAWIETSDGTVVASASLAH
jgi:hypothetical protein